MSEQLISQNRYSPWSLRTWWASLAYHHKWAEAILYLMFASGLLLWNRVEVIWEIEKWALLVHMLAGVSLFSLIVGAFWMSHRRLIVKSKKPFLRQTGTIIEWLLVICSVSGFYLFFWGAPGNTIGEIISDVHFYSSWLLVPLVFRHAMRWTVLRIVKK
ncbi:hypothetical protein [Vibrio sp. HN007]|uniref:hypothetical protein n=1 Tax=Vibrio iocasae TaxID=3098914 RepID=UPI0035D4D5ED